MQDKLPRILRPGVAVDYLVTNWGNHSTISEMTHCVSEKTREMEQTRSVSVLCLLLIELVEVGVVADSMYWERPWIRNVL